MSKTTTPSVAGVALTTPAQLERLGEHLHKLRLQKSAERLEALLQQAAAEDLPYADFLEQVLGEEVAAKTAKNVSMRTAMARFPFVKPLETFDFAYQPSLDKRQVLSLAGCQYIEHGDNVIILGPPGVGKTHLAVSVGIKAIEAGYRVLFTSAAQLIATLAEGQLNEKLKLYTTPRQPIDRVGANLFFQLIGRRYERGPMILTSNQSFGARVIAIAWRDSRCEVRHTMIEVDGFGLKPRLALHAHQPTSPRKRS